MQAFRKSLLVTLALTALLAACAPAQPSQNQVQSLVQTSVASTMQAQNQVSTFVAQTVQAQQPAATQAMTDTPIVAVTASPLPTLTPVLTIPSPTTVVYSGGGGGGGSVAPLAFSCGQEDWRPLDYTVFYAGENFEVKWTLENTGTQQWCESNSCSGGPDLTYVSGNPSNTNNFIASSLGNGPIQVPSLKPGKTWPMGPYSAVAPSKRGTWFMVWKLEDMQNSECLQFAIVVK
ncbi:MAG: NBR1-Ig-like domain-containing protein [Anaerolineales bacterium]